MTKPIDTHWVIEVGRLTAELDALSVAAMGRPGALTVDVLNEILQDRIDAQRECVRLTAELAELRAACEPIRRCAKLSGDGVDSFIQWYELLPLAALLGKKP